MSLFYKMRLAAWLATKDWNRRSSNFSLEEKVSSVDLYISRNPLFGKWVRRLWVFQFIDKHYISKGGLHLIVAQQCWYVGRSDSQFNIWCIVHAHTEGVPLAPARMQYFGWSSANLEKPTFDRGISAYTECTPLLSYKHNSADVIRLIDWVDNIANLLMASFWPCSSTIYFDLCAVCFFSPNCSWIFFMLVHFGQNSVNLRTLTGFSIWAIDRIISLLNFATDNCVLHCFLLILWLESFFPQALLLEQGDSPISAKYLLMMEINGGNAHSQCHSQVMQMHGWREAGPGRRGWGGVTAC